MSLRPEQAVEEMVSGGCSTFDIVSALILALAGRDDAGDKADGDLLAGILHELHGVKTSEV